MTHYILALLMIVFLPNIGKNRVYLWYVYCSNLFRCLRREINFGNNIVEIVRKSKRDERQMIWQEGERKVILAIAEIAIDQ